LIVGGGESVKNKIDYIIEFLFKNPDIFIIFSSGRNLDLFKKVKNKSLICITGNEITKINKSYLKKNKFLINNKIDDKTILPSKTTNFLKLKKNGINNKISNSPLAISLSATKELKAKNVYLIGFDGYDKNDKINDYSLFKENQKIFDFYKNKLNLMFLTDTIYENINKSSIYKYLS